MPKKINVEECEYFEFKEDHKSIYECFVKEFICTHPKNSCGICEKQNEDEFIIDCPYQDI